MRSFCSLGVWENERGRETPRKVSKDCEVDCEVKPHNNRKIKVPSEARVRFERLLNYLWRLDCVFLADIQVTLGCMKPWCFFSVHPGALATVSLNGVYIVWIKTCLWQNSEDKSSEILIMRPTSCASKILETTRNSFRSPQWCGKQKILFSTWKWVFLRMQYALVGISMWVVSLVIYFQLQLQNFFSHFG